MKRAVLFSFSDRGAALTQELRRALVDWEVECCIPQGDLARRTAENFAMADALIYVGASGIAVRAIAPNIRDKCSDPAVLVIDERGRYIIPILSGHLGGANELAQRLAAEIGGTAVITTATDINGRFSVDAWAGRKGLWISDMKAAKRFSAQILKEDMPIYSDFPRRGPLPAGVFEAGNGACGAAIGCKSLRPFEDTLLLVPRILHLGIGCKKGMSRERIEGAVQAALSAGGYLKQAVCDASTIELKAGEPGLRAFCAAWALPLNSYTSEALNACTGEFQSSEFVRRTVGVDNVCERSAACAAGPGAKIVVHKRCAEGVTVAIAQEDWSVCFE